MNATVTTVTEFMIYQTVNGTPKPLPHCGSWYSDRYYTDDLMGLDACLAAIDRVNASVPGYYNAVAVRKFQRANV